MPYSIKPTGSDFEVINDESGEVVGKHPTRKQALDQQRALYANVPDASAKEAALPAPLPTAEATGSFITRAFDALKGVLKEGRRNSGGDESRLQQIHDLAVANGAHCEPLVFKEASGRLRWVMFSSNSFQDTDREIVSQAALERDVERTDKEHNYGPLRWWHVGNPDKMTRSPGEGIDIGDCDFRAIHGRVLIESGTFRNERIGEAIKQRADKLAGSLGFFHPKDQPDSEGVFTDIRTFERSLLPKGRASNPLTALTVTKESQDMATMKEKFEEFVTLLGGDKQLAESVVSKAEQTEKEAQAQGLKFKEGDTLPDNATATEPAVVSEAAPVETTEKAGKGKVGSSDKPRKKTYRARVAARYGGGKGNDDQTKAMFARLDESGERTSEKAMQEPDGDEMEVDADEIFEALKEDIGALIDERLAAMGKETATKEAGVNSKITTLETQLKEAREVIAQLTGDLPRGVKSAFRASQSDATVSETRPAMQTKETANPIGTIYDWLVAPVQGQG